MKSSGSDSDLEDYFTKLKQQTTAKSFEHHDGLSDLTVSDSTDSRKNIKKKNPKKSQAKNKKENKFRKNDKPAKASASYDFTTKKPKSTVRSSMPKMDLGDIDKELGIGMDIKMVKSDDDSSSFGKDGKRFFKKKPADNEAKNVVEPPRNFVESLDLSSIRDVSSGKKSTLRSNHSPPSRKKVTIVDEKDTDRISTMRSDKSMDDFGGSESITENLDGENIMEFNILSIQDIMSDPEQSIKKESIKEPKEQDDTLTKQSPPKSMFISPSQERIMSIDDIMQDNDKPEVPSTKLSIIEKSISEENDSSNRSSSKLKHTIESTKNLANKQETTSQLASPKLQRQQKKDDGFDWGNSVSEVPSIDTDIHTERKSRYTINSERLKNSQSSIIEVPETARTGRSDYSKEYTQDFDSDDDKSQVTNTTKSDTTFKENRKSKTKMRKEYSENKQRPSSSSTDRLHDKLNYHPIHYHWFEQLDGQRYMPQNTAPTTGNNPYPIAQTIVSPEALESIAAYSPYMLLLTNTLKMQIEMTKSFIESQNRLYNAVVGNLKPNYQYCTLEDTKREIKSARARRHS